MKKMIIGVLVISMIAWALYDYVSSQLTNDVDDGDTAAQEETGLEKGMIAPDFELTTLEGEVVRLSEYRGQRVFVNFWATWCPPCRAEMPDMQKFYEEEDIEILAVNLTNTEKNIENVSTFIKDFKLTFPILMDEDGELAKSYKIQAYPTSFMIDSSGRIQFIALGAMNHDLMVQEFEKMK